MDLMPVVRTLFSSIGVSFAKTSNICDKKLEIFLEVLRRLYECSQGCFTRWCDIILQ